MEHSGLTAKHLLTLGGVEAYMMDRIDIKDHGIIVVGENSTAEDIHKEIIQTKAEGKTVLLVSDEFAAKHTAEQLLKWAEEQERAYKISDIEYFPSEANYYLEPPKKKYRNNPEPFYMGLKQNQRRYRGH